MLDRKALSVMAIGALTLLAACGTAPRPAETVPPTSSAADTGAPAAFVAPPAAGSPESKAEADSVTSENLIADCMRAQGFTYVPRPLKFGRAAGNLAGTDPALVPYEDLKRYRAKYGFGHFARDVYPDDLDVSLPEPPPNPNTAIRDALDEAGKKAYDLALDGGAREAGARDSAQPPRSADSCSARASERVYGEEKPADPAEEAAAAQAQREFQTDPRLLEAAQGYATCLRGQGYEVTAVEPGAIERTVEQVATTLHAEARGENLQQGLDREITMALEDLECGRAYEVVAKPKVEKVLAEGGVG
ncbi:hypothetical protein [Umezawaea sp.]|uniref:hypothetical protein n=1 Tax=Umezawaea sp. TaxID=1955258 RepID=UPI002ED0F04F